MNSNRYIRDSATGAVVLKDSRAVSDFLARKTIEDEIESLKREIHTLKAELQEMKRSISETRTGK